MWTRAVCYRQCLVSHRDAKLKQSHADDVTGGVHVADRQSLGLDTQEPEDREGPDLQVR